MRKPQFPPICSRKVLQKVRSIKYFMKENPKDESNDWVIASIHPRVRLFPVYIFLRVGAFAEFFSWSRWNSTNLNRFNLGSDYSDDWNCIHKGSNYSDDWNYIHNSIFLREIQLMHEFWQRVEQVVHQ